MNEATSNTDLAAVVLAAGKSTRMKSRTSKVLHAIAGRPLLGHVLTTLNDLGAAKLIVIVGAEQSDVTALAADYGAVTAVQDPPLGTGHAVMQARDALKDFTGDVLMIFGDTPLIRPETLSKMIARRREADDPAAVVYGFRPDDPALYGRLISDEDGHLTRIVEARDANDNERTVGLCNGGVMVADGQVLFDLLDAIGNDNARGEYYLTDIVSAAVGRGRVCAAVEGPAEETMGVDHRAALAAAEAVMQDRLRAQALEQGVTLMDPGSVHLSMDTEMGVDTVIEPNVFFGPNVKLGDNVTVKAFSHLEGATVAEGAVVGPFARLRPGADLAEGARVGNFVEVKNAAIEEGARVNHLSYVGDARVGAKANVGAGTITCNYDGYNKSHTDIGAGAFIGSNTALVAPVKIGDGAVIGAGSTIARDVEADAIALNRAEQKVIKDGAARLRAKKQAEKSARAKSNKSKD